MGRHEARRSLIDDGLDAITRSDRAPTSRTADKVLLTFVRRSTGLCVKAAVYSPASLWASAGPVEDEKVWMSAAIRSASVDVGIAAAVAVRVAIATIGTRVEAPTTPPRISSRRVITRLPLRFYGLTVFCSMRLSKREADTNSSSTSTTNSSLPVGGRDVKCCTWSARKMSVNARCSLRRHSTCVLRRWSHDESSSQRRPGRPWPAVFARCASGMYGRGAPGSRGRYLLVGRVLGVCRVIV